MPSNFPGGFDTFTAPLDPATTPLSEAGNPAPSARNHFAHHRDLGDAVMAVQRNVTPKTHTHDGAGVDGNNGPKLLQANTHENADTNASPNALHHTLGTGPNQAAAGDHGHTNLLDKGSTQTVTGKVTYPNSTTSGIVIPNFNNSQHSHANAATGGMAFSPVGNINSRFVVGKGVNKRANLVDQGFSIPTGMEMKGHISVQWRITSNGPQDIVRFGVAVSFGNNGVTYDDDENITTAGVTGMDVQNISYLTKQLIWVCQPALDGEGMGGFSVPFRTALTGGRWLKIAIINRCDKAIELSYGGDYYFSPLGYRTPDTWTL